MNVVLFGGTGMIGKGLLLECLESDDVRSIVAINRTPLGIDHPKLSEHVHSDLFDLEPLTEHLRDIDACFFCLGVSAIGMSEEAYRRITYELTISVAETLLALNPKIAFCYVSGAGTDSTGKGRIMWARVKGETENRLMEMFEAAYMFRPGYIQPRRGIKTKVRVYRVAYAMLSPLYPLIKLFFGGMVTDTERLSRTMIEVARDRGPSRILEARDL